MRMLISWNSVSLMFLITWRHCGLAALVIVNLHLDGCRSGQKRESESDVVLSVDGRGPVGTQTGYNTGVLPESEQCHYAVEAGFSLGSFGGGGRRLLETMAHH